MRHSIETNGNNKPDPMLLHTDFLVSYVADWLILVLERPHGGHHKQHERINPWVVNWTEFPLNNALCGVQQPANERLMGD